MFLLAIRHVLDNFVKISFPVPDSNPDTDHVQVYAKEVMSLGLLLMEFVDAIREGDGLCILRCWRFFLPIFKSSNRTIEAFTLLEQYEFLQGARAAVVESYCKHSWEARKERIERLAHGAHEPRVQERDWTFWTKYQ